MSADREEEVCSGDNLGKCPKVGKNLVCSLRGKAAMGGRRKRREGAGLGGVGRDLQATARSFYLILR